MDINDGFYPALGTPLDNNGNFIKESMGVQIDMMAEAGASGYLVLGTMGQQPCVKNTECVNVIRSTVDIVAGNSPIFAGCMDNSLARVKERINALMGLKIDGVVITTPYYFISPENDIINFFKNICVNSPFPVYLYDLPMTTKIKITYDMICRLSTIKNLKGIKSGDLILMRDLLKRDDAPRPFNLLFSGTELFDIAYHFGLTKQLDGFYCCIPKLTKRFYTALAAGNMVESAQAMDDINNFRNFMFTLGMFPAFTTTMNALGCVGNFHPDYLTSLNESSKERLLIKFRELGEI